MKRDGFSTPADHGPEPQRAADGRVSPRRRICGLETEYAVLYQPDDPEDRDVPAFSLIETILFNVLLENRKAARSLGIKGGYFLENGGLAHLEIFLHEQADTPVLELCTPECSNAGDLLVYQRAFDALLAAVSERSGKSLHAMGYRGRIAFGKNNLDSRGTGYGCHENYLVRHQGSWRESALVVGALPFLVLLSLPWIVFFVVFFLGFMLALCVYVILSLVLSLVRLASPELVQRLTRALRRLVRRTPRVVLAWLRRSYIGVTNTCLYPGITGFTTLLRVVAHRPYVESLTGLLVTRQIICGAGRIDPRSGRFELSQRACLTSTLAKIIIAGRKKTIFDLKGFLYQPLSLFRRSRKLTVCLGDSNLADLPNLLKVGMTSLVLDMIETGEDLSDLLPADPVAAFREISAGGPWKIVRLRGGRESTAIEIQREYLHRARQHFAGAGDGRAGEVIRLWEESLRKLADEPAALSTWLDWAAKKAILDRAVLATTNWKAFALWSEVLSGLRHIEAAGSLEAAVSRQGFLRRRALRRRIEASGLEPAEFCRMRDLYLQCRKIDLRYHEISGSRGYERELEAEGLIERLTDDESVARAISEPPQDTRARLRSYYIKLNSSLSRKSIQAGWDRVLIVHSSRAISLADPYFCRIPSE